MKPPFRNPALVRDVGSAFGASLRVRSRRLRSREDQLTHSGGALRRDYGIVRRTRGFSIFLVTQGASNLADPVRNAARPRSPLQLTHPPPPARAPGAREALPPAP